MPRPPTAPRLTRGAVRASEILDYHTRYHTGPWHECREREWCTAISIDQRWNYDTYRLPSIILEV